MHTTRALGPLIATLILDSAPLAEASTSPNASVRKVTAAGTGCAASAGAKAELGNGGDVLKLVGVALAVKNAPRGDARKACNVIVELSHAEGWQVSASGLTTEVEGKIAKGADGELALTAHFQGDPANGNGSTKLSGEFVRRRESLTLNENWSKCGATATLVLRTSLKLAGNLTAPSEARADGDTEVALKWRACQSTPISR